MKLLYIAVVLCFFVAFATAGIVEGVFKDPAHPGKCVVEGKVLSPRDVVQFSTGCGEIICGTEGRVRFVSCGVQGVEKGYKLGEPQGPNYPDCCHREYIRI